MNAKDELAAIRRQIEAAEDLRNYPGRYFPARAKAGAALAAWRAAHPQEAAAEDAAELDQAAERLREQADHIEAGDHEGARTHAVAALRRQAAACDWRAVAATWPARPDGSNPVADLARATAARLSP